MSERLSFDGRVALVTGAGRGMGRAHAMLFAARGAKVVVNNRSAAAAQATVDDIVRAGGTAVASVADVKDPAQAKACVDSALNAFGRIDIVVNNAGIAKFTPFDQISDAEFHDMLGTHFGGAWHVSQAAWPHMVAQGYGKIAMIASAGGIYGLAQNAHYCAAKGALFGLAQGLAREGAAHGICVNTVSTGGYTEMIEAAIHDKQQLEYMENHLPAWAAAPPVVWLCHEQCSATGEYYSAAGRRMSQFFQGETRGYVSENYTVEALRDNFDEVRRVEGFEIHADQAAALRWMSGLLGNREGAEFEFNQMASTAKA